jgi:hypothetical protein
VRLYSYVVRYDVGFAPNPFFGCCTLATCKPDIRKSANVGEWIIGLGSARYGLTGRLVFVMKVDEIITFDKYWNDSRFRAKRPRFDSGAYHAYGDNIYHRDAQSGSWIQARSRHSAKNGQPNASNIVHDTGKTENVLVGNEFIYFGGQGPRIPARFSNLIVVRGNKSRFSETFINSVIAWIRSMNTSGYQAAPAGFSRETID